MMNQKKRKFEMLLYIQMQLCLPHTLEEWLWSEERVQKRIVNMKEARNIFLQIIKGLAHVHAAHIIHRDIKPSNIFITADKVVKLGDFGLATAESFVEDLDSPRERRSSKKWKHEHTIGVGTHTYASPEQLSRKHYDTKSDIFSVGIILFEMLHPFSTKSERAHVLSNVRKGIIPKESIKQYPLEMNLVKECVNIDPKKRPSAQEILHRVKMYMKEKNSIETNKTILKMQMVMIL